MKKESFQIELFGVDLSIYCNIYPPVLGNFETPPEDGEIEITDIWYSGAYVFNLIEQIPNYEELIYEQINKQL